MRLIKSKFEVLEQEPGIEGIYKQIEFAGRTCYKSEDKITEGSAKKFVDMMIRSGHGAMLEHGTIYLTVRTINAADNTTNLKESFAVSKYDFNKYSVVISTGDYAYVTTNLRVLVENNWMDDLQYMTEPTPMHEKRVTVKFTCDRVTGESFLRHRGIDEDHPTIEGEVTRECERDIDSFARESTRFCNYSREKFGNELSIIVPPEYTAESVETALSTWECLAGPFRKMCASLAIDESDKEFGIIDTWLFGNLATEWAYFHLLQLGLKPEQARRVLPLDIKSPLVMTGFVSDWKHFFELRCDQAAHPQARELAVPLREYFKKNGLL